MSFVSRPRFATSEHPHSSQTGLEWATRHPPLGDAQTCTNPDLSVLHFTGQQRDPESNLDHFMFREYSSTQGRWMTPDPAGMAAVDPADPQSWNRYSYVANDPMNSNDPSGLVAEQGGFEGEPQLCITTCGAIFDPSGWVFPMPQMPPPRSPIRFPGFGVLPGESSLNWPLGPSPSQILSDILTGNFADLLGIDTSNCNPICDELGPGAGAIGRGTSVQLPHLPGLLRCTSSGQDALKQARARFGEGFDQRMASAAWFGYSRGALFGALTKRATFLGLELAPEGAAFGGVIGGAIGFGTGLATALAEEPVKRWFVETQAFLGSTFNCMTVANAPKEVQ
jgi:RHS repeat-associated protein